jgi:hypothetical protein
MMSSRLGQSSRARVALATDRAKHRFVPAAPPSKPRSRPTRGTRDGKWQTTMSLILICFLDDHASPAGTPTGRGEAPTTTPRPRTGFARIVSWVWSDRDGEHRDDRIPCWRSSKTRARQLHARKIRIPRFLLACGWVRLRARRPSEIPTGCRSKTEERTCPSQSGSFIRYSLEKSPA